MSHCVCVRVCVNFFSSVKGIPESVSQAVWRVFSATLGHDIVENDNKQRDDNSTVLRLIELPRSKHARSLAAAAA